MASQYSDWNLHLDQTSASKHKSLSPVISEICSWERYKPILAATCLAWCGHHGTFGWARTYCYKENFPVPWHVAQLVPRTPGSPSQALMDIQDPEVLAFAANLLPNKLEWTSIFYLPQIPETYTIIFIRKQYWVEINRDLPAQEKLQSNQANSKQSGKRPASSIKDKKIVASSVLATSQSQWNSIM